MDMRELARRRDGRCMLCLYHYRRGEWDRVYDSWDFDVHHIRSRGAGGTDDVGNLICLCRRHHIEVHNGKYDRGLLRGLISG